MNCLGTAVYLAYCVHSQRTVVVALSDYGALRVWAGLITHSRTALIIHHVLQLGFTFSGAGVIPSS